MELIVFHVVDYVMSFFSPSSSSSSGSLQNYQTLGAAKTASGQRAKTNDIVQWWVAFLLGGSARITDCDELGTFPPHVRIFTKNASRV